MTRQPALFVTGVIVVLVAVLSPLEAESARYFWVHMVQHMLMILVAGPLIAGSKVVTVRPPLLRSIVVVWGLHAAALWAWHMPALYDAGMRNDALHMLEHASFLVTAVLFWNVVFDARVDRFKRLGLVFGTMLQSGALGAVIAFASTSLYEWHVVNTPGDYGVLASQQLAGAIMWIPPGVVYLGIMVGLLARALSALDAAEQP